MDEDRSDGTYPDASSRFVSAGGGSDVFQRLSAPLAAISIVAVVVVSAGTGAVAQRLIGSKDVADNSLSGKDIKKAALRARM